MNADHLVSQLRELGTAVTIVNLCTTLTPEQELRFGRKFIAVQCAMLEKVPKLKRGHIVEILLQAYEYAVEAVKVDQPSGGCPRCGGVLNPERLVVSDDGIKMNARCTCGHTEEL